MIFLMKIPLALTSQLSDPHLLHAKTVPLPVSLLGLPFFIKSDPILLIELYNNSVHLSIFVL